MAETRRDLIVRMSADPEAFKRGMREAGRDSKLFWKELKELEKQQQAVDKVMTVGGSVMVGFGAAAAAGLAAAAKAAIDWESAWTGVTKVVDGSPEQLAALEEELRGLATTLPQTHAEIAGVAAAAGQLGIARDDISEFTQVMVAMGVSTDLASEDAAMAMARLMNIMQTAPDQVSNLGSAIVGLGNAGASTEAEIVEMALRIAGAGKTVGLTEAEVLGFASALASAGVEAESGGSSISTAMIKITEAVNEGGDSLETFAQVAGVSADEFANKFRSDPATAIDMFVQGLGRIQSSGGDVFGVMEELGLSEIRLRDNLLRLAGAGDLLTESLATGNQAWDENAALMEEASRRYGTTEAQMQIARNQLVDMGITLGEILLPAINKFLDVGSGLFAFFQSMPAGLQQTIVLLGVGAAAVTLLGGAALVAVPKVHALNIALGEMGTKKASMMQKALGGITSALGGAWVFAIGVAVTALGAFAAQQAEAKAKTDQLASTLDQQTNAVTSNTRAMIAQTLQEEGAFEMAEKLGVSQSELVDAIINGSDAFASSRAETKAWLEAVDEAGGVVGELNEGQKEQFDTLAQLDNIMSDSQGTFEDAVAQNENLLAAVDAETEATAAASGEALYLAETLGVTTGAAQDASDQFNQLDQQVRALIDSVFALSGAERDVEAGIDAVTEKLEENGATVDRNTESGRANEQAIEDQIAAIAALAVTTAEQTGSTEEANAVLATQRSRLESVMRAAGFTEDQIDDYTDALDDVPGLIETTVDANFNVNITRTERINRLISEGFIPPGFAEGGLVGFPDGGMIHGPGTGTSDSIIIRASDGEFVVNAEATAENRDLLEAINSGQNVSARRRHSPAGRHGATAPSGGELKITFDFANVGDDFARAIKNTVRNDGNGVVQDAFGSK